MLSKLSKIKKALEDIRPKTRRKGLCGVIKNIILRKQIAGSLQKCASDLDLAIEAFHVSSDAFEVNARADSQRRWMRSWQAPSKGPKC